jgi:hypothetical protein
LLGCAAVLGVAACDGPDLPVASDLRKVAETDGQVGFAGARLALPLAVTALTSQGEPVPRARIRWTVESAAGGATADTVSVADGVGRGETSVTLGPSAGAYTIRAALADDDRTAVTFTATAVVAPSLSAVEPSSFSSGDTVVVRGQGLADSLDVEFAGARAEVVAVLATGTELDVVVPACLPAGNMPIRVRYAGTLSDSVLGTYAASRGLVALAVGEYVSLDPEQLEDECAVFPASGPEGAEYLVVPQATTKIPGAEAQFRLVGDTAITVAAVPQPTARPRPMALRFHDYLRRWEVETARERSVPYAPPAVPEIVAPIEVGDRRSFYVCDTIACGDLEPEEGFTRVTAEARYVGEHAAILLDVDAPANALTDADFQAFGEVFDHDLYEVATAAFGSESDIDQNGHVLVLMTPVVNGLTSEAQCETSIITGFFFAIDINPDYQRDERSNKGEIFYAITPDPQGTVSCAHSEERIRRLVPVTFVHELQHMINYHQHVLVRGGSSEALWLNEGLSHLSEELAAFHFGALGDDERFSRFAIGDLFNAYTYLRSPGQHAMLFGSESTGFLEERGAAWLFLRWLTDQFGSVTPRRLVETSRTGADNVEAVAGEPFARLVSQWMLANYASDLPDFTAPPRLRHQTWRLRTTYASLHDQVPERFPVEFPIVPSTLTAPSFAASGTMHAGSGSYYLVVQSANAESFTMKLQDPADGPVTPAVSPRLNVLRLR